MKTLNGSLITSTPISAPISISPPVDVNTTQFAAVPAFAKCGSRIRQGSAVATAVSQRSCDLILRARALSFIARHIVVLRPGTNDFEFEPRDRNGRCLEPNVAEGNGARVGVRFEREKEQE